MLGRQLTVSGREIVIYLVAVITTQFRVSRIFANFVVMDFHCIFSHSVANDLRSEITITFWLIGPFRCSDTSGALVGKIKYSDINLPDFVHCCIPRG